MNRKKTHADFVDEIKGREIIVIGAYKTAKTKIEFKCSKCNHKWLSTPTNILSGTGCPSCANKSTSKKLLQSNKILKDNGDWLLIDISTPTHPSATMAIDTDVFHKHTGGRIWAYKSNRKSKYLYAGYSLGRKVRKIHHDILVQNDGYEVDHVEHGTLDFIDNRKSNLRLVTHSQNVTNQSLRSDNTSGVRGVSYNSRRGKWVAYIKTDGVFNYLGVFIEKEHAISARIYAEKQYHGEYAYNENN